MELISPHLLASIHARSNIIKLSILNTLLQIARSFYAIYATALADLAQALCLFSAPSATQDIFYIKVSFLFFKNIFIGSCISECPSGSQGGISIAGVYQCVDDETTTNRTVDIIVIGSQSGMVSGLNDVYLKINDDWNKTYEIRNISWRRIPAEVNLNLNTTVALFSDYNATNISVVKLRKEYFANMTLSSSVNIAVSGRLYDRFANTDNGTVAGMITLLKIVMMSAGSLSIYPDSGLVLVTPFSLIFNNWTILSGSTLDVFIQCSGSESPQKVLSGYSINAPSNSYFSINDIYFPSWGYLEKNETRACSYIVYVTQGGEQITKIGIIALTNNMNKESSNDQIVKTLSQISIYSLSQALQASNAIYSAMTANSLSKIGVNVSSSSEITCQTDNDCNNHGQCLAAIQNTKYICYCFSGWSGVNCQFSNDIVGVVAKVLQQLTYFLKTNIFNKVAANSKNDIQAIAYIAANLASLPSDLVDPQLINSTATYLSNSISSISLDWIQSMPKNQKDKFIEAFSSLINSMQDSTKSSISELDMSDSTVKVTFFDTHIYKIYNHKQH